MSAADVTRESLYQILIAHGMCLIARYFPVEAQETTTERLTRMNNAVSHLVTVA